MKHADLDPKAKHKLRLHGHQFIDSMCPANLPLMNPESLKLALGTRGASIRAGFANPVEDSQRCRLPVSAEAPFEFGVSVAVLKAHDEVLKLIQYAPLIHP